MTKFIFAFSFSCQEPRAPDLRVDCNRQSAPAARLPLGDAGSSAAPRSRGSCSIATSFRLSQSLSVDRYRRPPGRLSCGSPDPHIAAGGVDAANTAGLETGGTSRTNLRISPKAAQKRGEIAATVNDPLDTDGLAGDAEQNKVIFDHGDPCVFADLWT